MATLSASTWGDPTATKHVLLIHGITCSSRFWHRIAQEFASRGKFHNQTVAEHAPDMFLSGAGYFVTAPDLLGHGSARRSSDYTIATLVEELRPLFTTTGGNDHPYHVVVGHSLGASSPLPCFPFSSPLDQSGSSSSILLSIWPPNQLLPTESYSATWSGTRKRPKPISKNTHSGRWKMQSFIP